MIAEKIDLIYLKEFGKLIKAFKKNDTQTGDSLKNALLTPLHYGIIALDKETIDRKFKLQKSVFLDQALPQKGEQTNFAFLDCVVNFVDQNMNPGDVYESIIKRVNKFYTLAASAARNSRDSLHTNHAFLEFQFLHAFVQRKDLPGAPYHIIFFALVGEKETLESTIMKHRTANVNPGAVLTMIKKASEALYYLYYETNLFFPSAQERALFNCVPLLGLTDIYVFGGFDFRVNPFCFASTIGRSEAFSCERISNELTTLLAKRDLSVNLLRNELYAYNLNALGVMAAKYYLKKLKLDLAPDQTSTNEAKIAAEIHKNNDAIFKCEFEKEAGCTKTIVTNLLHAIGQSSDVYRPKLAIETFEDDNPVTKLIAPLLRQQRHSYPYRVKQIQREIINGNETRELELRILHNLIKTYLGAGFRPLLNDPKDPKFESERKKQQEQQEKNDKQKNVILPFFEVEYPLSRSDIDNISKEGERLVCQIYPVYDKDFFVYRCLTNQLMLSIEFNDDLTSLLQGITEALKIITTEVDNERRIVIRSAHMLQPFENELESHINGIDCMTIVCVSIIKRLNYCIEYEEFGRIARNTDLIIDEIKYHLHLYRQRFDREVSIKETDESMMALLSACSAASETSNQTNR